MKLSDVALLRSGNQNISNKALTVAELVANMGAIQAQDFAMSKWAIGLRVTDATEQTIDTAITDATIVRTHLLRPTWHIVSADDIYWILELTAPQVKSQLKTRHRELGIDDDALFKSSKILREILEGGQSLTREEISVQFENAGIETAEQRFSHLMLAHELDGLIGSGIPHGNKHTYALLEERIAQKDIFDNTEAIKRLALRYFTSHGPATLDDFSWWSGLNIPKIRKVMKDLEEQLVNVTVEGQEYWFSGNLENRKIIEGTVHLLPAYDEFLISYKDRSAALPELHLQKVLSKNGIFWPVIVENGRVIGTWSRSVKKEKVLITTQFFKSPTQRLKRQVEKAATELGNFLMLEAEVFIS